jgi:hypothetical protein
LFASEFQGPGMEILQNEIIGTQTSLVVVNWVSSCLFFSLSASTLSLHIFTLLLPVQTTYYNYSRTLCIKCWVSTFHTQI